MLVVGELINSSRRAIAQAIEQKEKAHLQDLACRQVEAGAHFIDINAASSRNEVENMKWLVNLVQEAVDTPLCIDSPSPEAIESALALCKRQAMINSITAEEQRWDELVPIITRYQAKVIALCMDDQGMPKTVEDRLRVADKLVSGLVEAGIPEDDIYLDLLVKPLGVDHNCGLEVLESTRAVRQHYPNVHIISGLSNVSYGLPERRVLNRAFMVMSVAMGMDAFILDPLDLSLMSLLAASRALAGKDEYCLEYISGVRAGKIKA